MMSQSKYMSPFTDYGFKKKWLYFLKHLEEFDKLPEIFKDEVFVNTLKRIELHSLPQVEQLKYERSLKSFRDRINEVVTAREEGREEGREEVAIKMLKAGIDIEVVAQCTGLNVVELKRIIS